jgi:hypothetical protein
MRKSAAILQTNVHVVAKKGTEMAALLFDSLEIRVIQAL